MRRRRTIIGLISLWLALSVTLLRAEERVRLRVLSYNIHHGAGVDERLDLARIAQVITSANPDVVALQEVDKSVPRSGVVDQPSELSRLTKMNVVFGSNLKLQDGEYGNALLSRFPITHQTNHFLPNVGSGEQRGVLEVELDVPGIDGALLIFATHFDHRRDPTQRVASAKFINRLADRHAERPALLAGDLNDLWGSATLNRLREMWSRPGRGTQPTVPVAKPTRQIDYVLLRPRARWKVLDVRVLDEAIASDHRAILAVLELMPTPKS